MDKKRKVYAPFSLTSEAGVAQTPVEGYIDVNQAIYPTVQTGVVNENGTWVGVKADDNEFIGFTKHIEVANGGAVLAPVTSEQSYIDMSGFADLFIAIKPSRGGECALEAVMGPDTNRFANLEPVDAAAGLFGSLESRLGDFTLDRLFKDSAQALTADVWNIFIFQERLAGQKMMQFKITNNSGGISTIEFAYMRLV